MDRKIYTVIAAVSLVVAAGGIGAGVKANNAKRAALDELAAMRAQQDGQAGTEASAENGAETTLVALKESASINTNDLAELQEQLAARDAELERLRAAMENRRENQGQPRQSFQERMEQLKQEDPERYAEIVQRRTERQEEMRYDQANRLAAFMNMDTSMMSEEELANHNLLIQKLSEVWDATEAFDPQNPPDREAMRAAFGSMREIGQLMDMERTVMFKQLGTEVGLSASESEEFASYVDSIIETTSLRPPRGMRGDRGAPPAGGGN